MRVTAPALDPPTSSQSPQRPILAAPHQGKQLDDALSLEVDPGSITAQVQGSRARPYRIRIGIPTFGKSEWAQVERILAENAWYTAKLLSGEMPEDIEEVFAGLGLSLFPATPRELSLDCSCPDHAVPCKHIAATFYLLAESFDDDPFAILAWRGREREDLLANLAAARTKGAPAADRAEQAALPLDECLDTYYAWQADVTVPSPPATPSTALLDQLPDTGVAARGRPLTELLRPAYDALGRSGQAELAYESAPGRSVQTGTGRP